MLHFMHISLTVSPLVLNQRGHTSYGWNKYRIHKEVAEAFFEGLNQADPLLNVVNVGQLKEAADMKIRGKSVCLKATRHCSDKLNSGSQFSPPLTRV